MANIIRERDDQRAFVLAHSIVVIMVVGVIVAGMASRCTAASLSGSICYSGSLGPVSDARPIVVALSDDPSFEENVEVSVTSNCGSFNIDVPAGSYYLVYFLDLYNNGDPDKGEPVEAYNDHCDIPGDLIAVPQAGLELEFNDTCKMIGPGTTCPGDCDGDGNVGIAELITGVSIALDNQGVDTCPAFDTSGDRQVSVSELIAAVNAALGGCVPPPLCDLSGVWRVTSTEISNSCDPVDPPETEIAQLVQDDDGNVTVEEAPEFAAHVQGNALMVDFCEQDPDDPPDDITLYCTTGQLTIAPDCDSFSGTLSWTETRIDSGFQCTGIDEYDATRVD